MVDEVDGSDERVDEGPACKQADCDCEGFVRNPLIPTDCLRCHHDWQSHY